MKRDILTIERAPAIEDDAAAVKFPPDHLDASAGEPAPPAVQPPIVPVDEPASSAIVDAVTGLPNRVLFYDRLGQALAQARRFGYPGALMLIDLNGFHAITNTQGAGYGDLLLHEVAQRLLDCSRESDTVARLDGGTFGAILPGVRNSEDAAVVAGNILTQCAQPIAVDGRDLCVTVGIGVSLYPGDGCDIAAIVRNAEAALRHAAKRGESAYQLFQRLGIF